MRTKILVIVVMLFATARLARAQYAGAMPGPSCQAPQMGANCQTPQMGPNCNCGPNSCNPCQQPPCGPPREATPPNPVPRDATPPSPPVETGVFVAPPRSGTSRGATGFRGVNFGT